MNPSSSPSPCRQAFAPIASKGQYGPQNEGSAQMPHDTPRSLLRVPWDSSPVCHAKGPEPRGDIETGLPEDKDLSEGGSLKQAM